jgi:hypothetical protein
MTKFRKALLLTGTAGLLTAGLSTPALTASAKVSTFCTIEVTRLEAMDLKEENGKDEIKIRLGDTWHGKYDFERVNQWRSESLNEPIENFSGSVTVTLYEVDLVTRTRIAGISVPCTRGNYTADFEGNGAGYEMKYTVT